MIFKDEDDVQLLSVTVGLVMPVNEKYRVNVGVQQDVWARITISQPHSLQLLNGLLKEIPFLCNPGKSATGSGRIPSEIMGGDDFGVVKTCQRFDRNLAGTRIKTRREFIHNQDAG
jgi:hypothetical protein